MLVLGIETSCDETSAAIVKDGRQVLSCVVYSQVDLHGPYGGVVPELASRSHVEVLPGVIEKAINDAGVGWGDVDEVAVTYGPGLASSLLVGLSAAKGLALSLDRPLVLINHIESHIYSAFLAEGAPAVDDVCPCLGLIVSGGHTTLLRMEGLGRYRILGQTIDDAAGEAFDKGANLLGLGYPGGPVIDKLSKGGDPKYVHFPRGAQRKATARVGDLDPELCFSYSGLKTALLYYLKEHPVSLDDEALPSVVASYQAAIIDALITRCDKAMSDEVSLLAGGGVSLNSSLRSRLQELAERRGVPLLLAPAKYCADNAAMIAGLAGAGQGIRGDAALLGDVEPNLAIRSL